MQKSADLQPVFARFETVEWLYDGLNGRIIPWTKQHGGTSDDPSGQAFVVGVDGRVLARCPDAKAHAASAFATWAGEQADLYEKSHPRTRVQLLRAGVSLDGSGADARATCQEYDAALAARQPILLYVGRDSFEEADRVGKAEAAAAAKLEKGALDSKSAAEASVGWRLLRIDLARAPDRAFAALLGVKAAPALVLVPVPAEGAAAVPQILPRATDGASLAYALKKHGPAAR